MGYNFRNVKILIVESSTEMYKLFRDVLIMLDVPESNITAAYTKEQAYDKFRLLKHDLIITDWLQNPDHGIQLTERIRRSESSPNKFVPIIMTAGSGHYSRVVRSRDAGISEYLVKPFAANALTTRITRVIENPRKFVVHEAYTGPDRRVREREFDGDEKRLAALEEVAE